MNMARALPLVVLVLSTGCAPARAGHGASSAPSGHDASSTEAAASSGEPEAGAGYGTSADDTAADDTAVEDASGGEAGRLAVDTVTRQSKVRVGKIVTPAGAEVDTQLLARAVRIHVGDLRACYDKGLESQPEMEGRVVYHVALGIDGAVLGINVGESSLPDAAVIQCVKDVLSKVQFDARERQATRFELPLLFAP